MLKDVLDQLGSLTLEKDHFLVNINKARRRGGGQDRGGPRAGGPGGGRARVAHALQVPLVRAQKPRPRRLAALALQGMQVDILHQDDVAARHFLVNINTYSKLAPEVWSDYVSDMLSGAPLGACAELCGCRSRRPGSCACACAR